MKIICRVAFLGFVVSLLTLTACAAEHACFPLDIGVTGDGITDHTAAFQRLLDEAGRAGGGVVEVPAGRYVIRGTLSIPANVTLQGVYRVPPTVQHNKATGNALGGTVLMAYTGRGSQQGPPFIRLAGSNAAISGLIVTYPEWKQTDVPPMPYPPCVLADHVENTGIENCLLLNPYEAIKLVKASRHLVRNVTGYPSWRGLYVDECTDIGRIENIHFWPFGVHYVAEDPYCLWINTHGVAFEFARTDWHYVYNTFCFGYGVGYKFSESKTGCANGNFLGIGADSCQCDVLVEQAQAPGLLITNGEFVGRWKSRDAVCVEIAPRAVGKVSLVNCSFWGPIDRCVWMRSPVGQFTASACHFGSWDVRGVGEPAIQLDAGRAIVQGCDFTQEGPHVHVAAAVSSALLVGNQAMGGFVVDNLAAAHTQLAANEPAPFEWTAKAKQHYHLKVGVIGDGAYLQHWYHHEGMKPNGGKRSWRWSTGESALKLPVVPGKPYTLTLKLEVPSAAVSPQAGIYRDGKRLAAIKAGSSVVKMELAPSASDFIELKVVCNEWSPALVIPHSKDDRLLGLQLSEITMRTQGAEDRIFQANSGQWEPR